MTPLESQLRRIAAALSPTALESFSNKGLLRRAQKDFERGPELVITRETADALFLGVGGFEVSFTESGPASAACSCPASGVCQHILTAILFLQKPLIEASDSAGPDLADAGSQISVEEEVGAITPAQLEGWAGKTDFNGGLKLASQRSPDIIRDKTIRIHYPDLNSEVHLIPGAGLNGMFVSGGKANSRQMIVAAVIGFQISQGTIWEFPLEGIGLQGDEGSPRSRKEILECCNTLLQETLANGLSRLSAGNQQRWATLAVSAVGGHLPRLALSLRAIGDEAALILSRDAQSDGMRMLTRMAQAFALCSALQNGGDNPRPDLVGQHRSQYSDIGNLDLLGVSAWPWKTASGYYGLTLLFWDPSAKLWNSWTESRPIYQDPSFHPVARYTQAGPWEGSDSPRQLARASFRLMNARRNPHQRLSSSGKSRVVQNGKSLLHQTQFPAIREWRELIHAFQAQISPGLKELNPLNAWVAVKPASWGQRRYDPITQRFTWVIRDSIQQDLNLEIEFTEFAEPAISFLEKIASDALQDALIIGRLQRTIRGLSIHPCTIHQPSGEVIHLFLDTVNSALTSKSPTPEQEENPWEFEEEHEVSNPECDNALSNILNTLDDELLSMAESGATNQNANRAERIKQITLKAKRLGLHHLANALEQFFSSCPRSIWILRAAHISQMHRKCGLF